MDQALPKILFYNFGSRFGGAENVLFKFLEYGSDAADYSVLLNEEGQFHDRLKELGIPVTVIETRAKRFHNLKRGDGPGLNLLTLLPIFLKLFLSFFREHPYDLIVSNTFKSHLILGFAAWLMRTPVVWRFHDILQNDFEFNTFSKLNLRLLRFLSGRVVEISAVSQAVADSFIAQGFDPAKVKVVHNGVGSVITKQGASQDLSRIRVGWVGQFTPWKGIEEFLRIAVNLIDLGQRQGRRLEIRIAGSALFDERSYEEQLKAIVPKTHQDHIHFLGHLSNVDELYAGIDIFFHTAIAPDPFPTTVLEAGAHGLLVIASPLGGAREVIADGVNGYIRSIDDQDEVLELLARIINEPGTHLDMGERLRQTIQTTFPLETYHGQLEAELLELARAGTC